jgi:AMP-binding enzyme C-terminal domain
MHPLGRRLTTPAELASHPHILEVSVVARSHPKWGERPMAFVILHKHHVKTWEGIHDKFTQELKQHARARLPGFACPEWVQIVEDLPVSINSDDRPLHRIHQPHRKHQQARFSRQIYGKLSPSCKIFVFPISHHILHRCGFIDINRLYYNK